MIIFARCPNQSLGVMVNSDMSWILSVHGHEINPHQETYGFLGHIPEILSQQFLQELVELLDSCSICPGSPDEQLIKGRVN